MTVRSTLIAATLAWAFVLIPSEAVAFNCTATEGEECIFNRGPLVVVFEAGQYSFDGDSQLNGVDGQVGGYTAGTFEFPDLKPLDLGSGRFGFEFSTPMFGSVGGSGVSGDHEVSANFRFEYLRFDAAPGWRIDSLELAVTGEKRTVGVASVALNVPGALRFAGDLFTTSGILPLESTGFGAGFSAWTTYEEDGDGGAASYGTAYARFDNVRLVAQLSPVPEPATALLWLMGAALLRFCSMRQASRWRLNFHLCDPTCGVKVAK
ncbi:PEP-CTERM sorting domain-containing protein [Pseudaquabacterium pictum]|uniref:Ice-binding protein C-terminal domain-containing protein n=1 Tax=Pseudaquabacterium pictum TaxID=2315236 RepID=A0A480AUJ8_9BURK|nr:PEP-CTERM sorting domain-containing protein [Rubrivivax pictus]GCL65101.1 hypothetical protein AQPW35_41820 [Rubrivivax pictus]